LFSRKCRWFQGSPMWNPERAYTCTLVEDLRNVATFLEDSHAEEFVLDADRTASFEANFSHILYSQYGCY
jgi:hypothetical protein